MPSANGKQNLSTKQSFLKSFLIDQFNVFGQFCFPIFLLLYLLSTPSATMTSGMFNHIQQPQMSLLTCTISTFHVSIAQQNLYLAQLILHYMSLAPSKFNLLLPLATSIHLYKTLTSILPQEIPTVDAPSTYTYSNIMPLSGHLTTITSATTPSLTTFIPNKDGGCITTSRDTHELCDTKFTKFIARFTDAENGNLWSHTNFDRIMLVTTRLKIQAFLLLTIIDLHAA